MKNIEFHFLYYFCIQGENYLTGIDMNTWLKIILLLIVSGFGKTHSQIMVNWINMDGLSIDTLGVLVSEQTDSSYSYGAESQNVLKFNEDGYVSYCVNQTGKTRMLGLKKLPYATAFSATSVNYGFKISYTNQLYRLKKGSTDLLIDTVSAGDLLKVSRTGDSIYYYVNGIEKDKLYYNNDTNMTAIAVIYSSGGRMEYVQCNFIPSVIDSFNLTDDARVKSTTPTVPGGSDTYISASLVSSKNNPKTRSYLKLPVDSIPSDVEIVEAKLMLYGSGHKGSNASYLRRVTSTWTESSVTWNTQPSSVTDNQISLSTVTGNQNKEVDVTSFVSSWYNGTYTNYGLLLILQSEITYGLMNFGSSDNTTTSLKPILQVTYRQKIPYAVADENISGSIYLAENGRVAVYFEDEYVAEDGVKLIYTMYDNTGSVVAGVDENGNLLTNNSPVLFVNSDDNNYLFNFSNSGMVSGAYYTLELIDHGGFKKQLLIKM